MHEARQKAPQQIYRQDADFPGGEGPCSGQARHTSSVLCEVAERAVQLVADKMRVMRHATQHVEMTTILPAHLIMTCLALDLISNFQVRAGGKADHERDMGKTSVGISWKLESSCERRSRCCRSGVACIGAASGDLNNCATCALAVRHAQK